MITKDNRKNLIQSIIYTLIVLISSNILWCIGYKDEGSDAVNPLIMGAQFLPMILCLIMTKITGEGWNNLGITIRKKSWKYFAVSIILIRIFYAILSKGIDMLRKSCYAISNDLQSRQKLLDNV